MFAASAAERDLAQSLITALNWEAANPDSIAPEAPLLGRGDAGFSSDSIHTLENALAVQQKYGIELRADDENSEQVFGSLRALSAHVQTCRKT